MFRSGNPSLYKFSPKNRYVGLKRSKREKYFAPIWWRVWQCDDAVWQWNQSTNCLFLMTFCCAIPTAAAHWRKQN